MASSMTMTASLFGGGGAVAAKPAVATTCRSQLAVRASMDLEKVGAAAAETSNTRRGLVLAGMAAAAASSVAKVAIANVNIVIPPPFTPVDPSAPEISIIAKFAVSDHNKQKKTSLTLESVLKAEKQVFAGVNYKLVISARDGRPVPPNNYEAIVVIQDSPTSVELNSRGGNYVGEMERRAL